MVKVGQFVYIFTHNKNFQYNGAGIGPYPALVTQVWSDSCINVKVMPSCGPIYELTSLCRAITGEEFNWWEPMPKG
jgi:hypothetical protein